MRKSQDDEEMLNRDEDVIEWEGEACHIGVLIKSVGFLAHMIQIQERELHRASGTPVSPGVYSALSVIERNPGIRQGLLANVLLIQESNMAPLIRKLTADGFIERRAHPEKHRAITLWVTAKGKQLLKSVQPIFRTIDREFANVLPDHEYDDLVTILAKLFRARWNNASDPIQE